MLKNKMISPKFNLINRYCLITGAAGLLGNEHAEALLEINAKIILTDINTKKLNLLKKRLIEKYSSATIEILKMDVSSEKSIKKTVTSLKKKNISLYCLINNAAIDSKISRNDKMSNSSSFEKTSINDWEKHISVGLTGAMLCAKNFGKMIVANKTGGVIINVASDLSVIAPNHKIYKKGVYKPVMYSVVKHGIIGLTKYISTYWHNKRLRCNAISPGPIKNNQSLKFINKLKSQIPLNRLALKNDYRGAIQFLSSDASSYMTGQNLIIDGGRSVW